MKEHMTSEQKNALNQYYFVLGLGSDIYVMDKLFIRPMAMFGIQMNPAKDNPFLEGSANLTVKNGFNYMINAGLSVGYQIK